ncbi:MAG: WD40 repeat domain-containing protein [Chloroflexia bacterium]
MKPRLSRSTRLAVLAILASVCGVIFFVFLEPKLWALSRDTPTRLASQVWTLGKPVSAIAFTADGEMVGIGLDDGTLQVRSATDGSLVQNLNDRNTRIEALSFTPDGLLLAYSSLGDLSIRLQRVRKDSAPSILNGHTDHVKALAVSPDGKVLASAAGNREVRLWQVPSGKLIDVLPASVMPSDPVLAQIIALEFSSDGQTLFIGRNDDTMQQWSLVERRIVHMEQNRTVYQDYSTPYVGSFAINTHEDVAATVLTATNEIYVWGLSDGRRVHTLGTMDANGWKGHQSGVWSLKFSPDGQLLASGGGKSESSSDDVHDMSIRIWSMVDGREQAKLEGHTNNVRSLAWSPDGRLLASGSDDGTVRLWQVK